MSSNLPNPAPEPFDPRSAKEVAERFGEEVADQWFAATTGRRKAMIKQLLALVAHEEKRRKEESENRVIVIDDEEAERAEDARRAERRKQTFGLNPSVDPEKIVALLTKSRDRYLEEMAGNEALLRDPNVARASRLREDLAKRCMQVHAIDMLMDGSLAYDALRARVRADERCAELSDIGLEYEYDELLLRFLIKGVARKAPSPPAS